MRISRLKMAVSIGVDLVARGLSAGRPAVRHSAADDG